MPDALLKFDFDYANNARLWIGASAKSKMIYQGRITKMKIGFEKISIFANYITNQGEGYITRSFREKYSEYTRERLVRQWCTRQM